jgi:hypothetical protein
MGFQLFQVGNNKCADHKQGEVNLFLLYPRKLEELLRNLFNCCREKMEEALSSYALSNYI